MNMKGIDLIVLERNRQQIQEGWTSAHDDTHQGEEMAFAAAYYAHPDGYSGEPEKQLWPHEWNLEWAKKKKHGRIHQLAIAGALAAAEIDRLLRLEDSKSPWHAITSWEAADK